MTFTIETGIEVPVATRVRADAPKYPFAIMKVGDSFLIPAAGAKELEQVEGRMRGAVGRYTKQENGTVKFTVRRVEGGIRTWRTA